MPKNLVQPVMDLLPQPSTGQRIQVFKHVLLLTLTGQLVRNEVLAEPKTY